MMYPGPIRGETPLAVGSEIGVASDSPTAWSAVGTRHSRSVERQTVHEVDERAVVRPDRKVVMDTSPRNIDLTPDFFVGLRDEYGIPFRRWVVDNTPSVGRPVELGDAFQVRHKRAAQRGNRPS